MHLGGPEAVEMAGDLDNVRPLLLKVHVVGPEELSPLFITTVAEGVL